MGSVMEGVVKHASVSAREHGIENDTRYFVQKKDKECKGGNCQKIISEDELAEYLTRNWKVVTALPSGRLMVTNE